MYRHNITALLALFIIMTLTSCSSKQKTKDALIADIEHYNIDTVVAKPLSKPVEQMTDAEKCRMKADEVLRRYPELYNAANQLTEKYNIWLEREEAFIRLVFIDNDKQRSNMLLRNQQRLSKRLEQMNVIEPLCAAIYDENDAAVLQPLNMKAIPDEKTVSDSYHSILMAIGDVYAKGHKTGKPDERMTACNVACKSWNEYVAAFPKFLNAVPEQCRDRVQQGLIRIQQLHLIDIRNLYLTYWSDDKPQYLISDDVNDDTPLTGGNDAIFHYIQ